MPTSARASAGASFTPSPTIATADPRLEVGDRAVLVFGEDLGEHLVDAELAADGVGDLAGVAGDHHDRDPERCSSSTASRDSGRTSSSSASAPTMPPSRTT